MRLVKLGNNYLSTTYVVLFILLFTYILLGDLMKKVIEGFSLLFLICFSFFYTDKVMDMINKKDPLMEQIVNKKSDYEILPVNAIIDDDTIIPGVNGREIDIDESYDNMKSGGIFREEALVFKDLYPNDSLSSNKNKYIVKGYGDKNEVAIITIFNNNYIDKVMEFDNITVFINHKDLTTFNIKLLNKNEIYTYGNGGVYSEEILVNDNALINRLSNNKSSYCLVKNKDDSVLKVCNNNEMYVVLPNVIGGYYNIKNNISSGSIIFLDDLNDIDVIVKYIKSKGYDIVGLSELLSE